MEQLKGKYGEYDFAVFFDDVFGKAWAAVVLDPVGDPIVYDLFTEGEEEPVHRGKLLLSLQEMNVKIVGTDIIIPVAEYESEANYKAMLKAIGTFAP